MYPLPDNPKISIIIPSLNEEKLIGQTLREARQVAPDAEIILVDGGSEDRTVDLASKLAEVRSSNGTIAAARNIGARASSGDILVFLDADTKITKKFMDEAKKFLDYPQFVGAGGLIMPNRVGILDKLVFYFFNLLIMVSFWLGRPVLAGTCVAYKRKAFFDVGGFNDKMVASEDFDLCKRISKNGRVVFLRHVTICTSRRRLEKLGLFGLIVDWLKVTMDYFLGRKVKNYRIFR